MSESNRRGFLRRGAVAAAGATAAVATPAAAQSKPAKKAYYRDGKKPEKTPLFSSAVSFGGLVFIAGVGGPEGQDVTSQTKWVLDTIEKQLQSAGSSMEKVLKCNVYLTDIKDFASMNEAYLGRFGSEPPVRTTIAAAALPNNALVEIDVIASL